MGAHALYELCRQVEGLAKVGEMTGLAELTAQVEVELEKARLGLEVILAQGRIIEAGKDGD
jgi:5-methylthioribose kinase